MKDSPAKLEGLVRSLNLVPYLRKHPGATPMEIARDLGSSHDEVMADLTRLSLSGVGNGPGELIDLVASWTGITLIDDQGLNRPLRLTPTEANALLLTLETLETMPGLIDHAAVNSAAAKLRAVTRGRGIGDAEHPAGEQEAAAAAVSRALAQGSKLQLRYYSASSDATTTRTVSPLELFHRDGETYLRALEEGREKTFRLDRIRAAETVDAPAETAPNSAAPGDPFGFARAPRAELAIRTEATWLADYWEIDLGDAADEAGWVRASMPYGSPEWLIRFCLSQGDRLRLTEPVELAAEIARRARTAAQGLR